ncbi:MAG TPA: chromosome partitioning protein ParB [Cyanobacteria bacterium UBA11369]|nr:chromosome partitioning protein ParB [Cyanobacteria bacterium UBA11371]HBE34975.1 chromosome partitioning protein ParB [Cyanobacteria bacterium UBA11368]HBE49031.1 chromosome partitioning protein ParB [Cyanobacteria bacterium UBA11369]
MNENNTTLLACGNEIQHIELDRLKQHPRNEEVYGSCESITDLVESIKLKGYIQPLIVKADGTIISGHRRWRALTALERKEAPVIVRHFETEEDELFVLIAENRHRHQTEVQRIREGMTVEPIARKLRNSHATQKASCATEDSRKPQSDDREEPMENFPLDSLNLGLTEKEMELTENIVAAIVGLGCGRNYRKGRTAVLAADDLKKDCPKLARVWLDIINDQSIDAGYQIAKMPENKQRDILEAIASGAANTLKQAKALIKTNPPSSSSEAVSGNGNDGNAVRDNVDGDGEPSPDTENGSTADVLTEDQTSKKHFTPESVGSWVIVKIPLFALDQTPERKWNGFWGRITEVGITLKVDMGTEIVPLLESDVVEISDPTPTFCEIAERVLRLQSFETVHEFGKVILNRMQQTSCWDTAALTYLDAVEQIELARRAIEQAL